MLSYIFINCENIGIWSNIFYLRELKDEETVFFLEIDDKVENNQKMKIELFLSHPSSYQIYFNYSDEIEKEEEEEFEEKEEEIKDNENEEEIFEEENKEEINKTIYNEILENKNKENRHEEYEEIKNNKNQEYDLSYHIEYLNNNNFFQKSLRKLYEYPNNLIELEEEISTKKIYILNLNENMTIIQLIIKKIKDIPEYSNSFCYIKYQCNEKNFKNYKFSNILNTSLTNGAVSVSFEGIIPDEENIINDFQIEYEAFLYRKNERENYENINHIFLPNKYCSRSGTLKYNNINNKIYNLILTGIEQNGNEQWLEVQAEILYGNDREYFVYNLTLVYIENRNKVIPDDNIDNKTNNDTDIDNKNKKYNNDNKFYIIIICFILAVILTFGIIYIFIYVKKKGNIDIEDNDYENIGTIEKKDINEEEGNIN